MRRALRFFELTASGPRISRKAPPLEAHFGQQRNSWKWRKTEVISIWNDFRSAPKSGLRSAEISAFMSSRPRRCYRYSPLLPLASHALAEEVWSLEGFQAPESVLLDAQRNVLYVSNVAGEPNGKDGVGFISKVSPDGSMQEAEWVTGLNAPKGMAMSGDRLYVSDVDRLVEIDVESGEITNTWQAEGAQFLNDTVIHGDGRVFVSDMLADSIYVLENGALSVWLQDAALEHPNGLHIEDGRLLVAAWGADIQPDFTTKSPGRLFAVNLDTKEVSAVGSGEPIGNLDGLEADGTGNWIATDWIAGGLLRIKADGSSEQLLDLNPGSADLEFVQAEKLAIVPMMMDGKITSYRIE